jgi:hypothetical protein
VKGLGAFSIGHCPSSGTSVAEPSGDHIPLGGFVLKTGFDADAAAKLKWATLLVENLASLYGVHSAPLDHRKIGFGSGLAPT